MLAISRHYQHWTPVTDHTAKRFDVLSRLNATIDCVLTLGFENATFEPWNEAVRPPVSWQHPSCPVAKKASEMPLRLKSLLQLLGIVAAIWGETFVPRRSPVKIELLVRLRL